MAPRAFPSNMIPGRRPKGALLNADRTPTNDAIYPIVFGIQRTVMLMYIAIHPGCTKHDVVTGTGISSRSWDLAHKYFKKHGLLVTSKKAYRINPGFRGIRLLIAFLRNLAKVYGVEPTQSRSYLFDETAPKNTLAIPDALFIGKRRAEVLMILATLTEVYGQEVAVAMSMSNTSAIRQLRALESEGLVISHGTARLIFFSLNDQYPGITPLRSLLRRMVQDRSDVQAFACHILMRRAIIMADNYARTMRLVLPLRRGRVISGIDRMAIEKTALRLARLSSGS